MQKKFILTVLTAVVTLTLLVSCSGGMSGTYIPKNETAKTMSLTKIVFKGSTVKVYMGMPSIAGMPQMDLGTAIELRYKLEGGKVIIEGGIPGINGQSIEFQYNKKEEELSLLKGMFGGGLDEYAPVWGKEGSFDPNEKQTETSAETKNIPAKKEGNTQSENNTNSWNYNPYKYYQELAEKCALYSKYVYKTADIVEELTVDGYSVKIADYYDNKKENGIGYILAHKKVNENETLLTVVVRSTVSEEWKGNMDISTDKFGETTGLHKSFMSATLSLQGAVTKYIEKNKLKNINFLITGHSRGAAVANILAIYLDNESFKVSEKKKVFAYAFATPNYSSDLEEDGYNYNNIFNLCFRDDFVTRVPLNEWGYGKLGVTYWAVAENLNKINNTFSNNVKNKVFNYQAVKDLLPAIQNIAPTVSDYYDETKIDMGFGHNPRKNSLYKFMKNYVAQAQIDGLKNLGTAGLSLLWDAGKESADVHAIADFLIDGTGAAKYIADTHDMWTYIYALKANGFLTK
ncbi:MAG: hypothetical protein LBN23_00080 [Paludibacter sp.]|jgi:hypothetical protein|nr:hypothetical protein [Paludibacter sp.]